MNNTIKTPQKSSIFPENPYDATGYHDRKITSPIEVAISRIPGDFGRNCQNDANFAARVGLGAAQKSDTHQKTTATKARRGFTFS